MVPDFQSIMLPLLELASDNQEHTVSEAIQALAGRFGLVEEDRKQLLPSGRQAMFDNRVGWSRTYLAKAGLLENTGRGRFRITARGRDVLNQGMDRISVTFLKQFPEFVDFHTATKKVETAAVTALESPEELLEASYQSLRTALAQDLLARIKSSPPEFFERLVVDLLVGMGYGGSRKDAGTAVGQTGDGGIDGIINEDRLGLDVVYIQAKRWSGSVGSVTVREFAGSLEGHRAQKGVLITTSAFTRDAEEFVQRVGKKIILIGGERLADLMIDFNIGVTPLANYEIKRMDLDYFPEERDQPNTGAIDDPTTATQEIR
jgi:restriction system protein